MFNPDDLDASDRDINFNLGWFAHAIYINGDYPEVMKKNVAEKSKAQGYTKSRLPEFTPQEKLFINGKSVSVIKLFCVIGHAQYQILT